MYNWFPGPLCREGTVHSTHLWKRKPSSFPNMLVEDMLVSTVDGSELRLTS